MVVAPPGSFSVPVCKNCGAVLVGFDLDGDCPVDSGGLRVHPGEGQGAAANGKHDVEWRMARLEPRGLQY